MSATPQPQPEPVLVIACGALGRELHALKQLNGWDHLRIRCLDPTLHLRPHEIAPRLRAELERATGQYRRIFIGYADCGSYGGIDGVLADYPGVARLPGLHCYDVFAGAERIARLAEDEPGTFYLTDFLARFFDRLVVQPSTSTAIRNSWRPSSATTGAWSTCRRPGIRNSSPRPGRPRPGWGLSSPTCTPATVSWTPTSPGSLGADAWTPCWSDGATFRRRSSSSGAGSAPRCC